MDSAALAGSIPVTGTDDSVVRKVFRRLIWFLFVLYVISFLDRINVAFAGLSMNRDLGLTSAMFGLSISIYYVGYLLCEIPSNLMLARYGARTWIARIMVTWGIASAATMFVAGPYSLFAIRLLVGIAEAGFLPGILLYMTFWFPRAYRARAMSLFIMATPITLAFGSAISGLILQMDNFLGLAGWRWLFLLEGLPAIILGAIAFFYLPDGPANAEWLTEHEKSTLQARLERERILEARDPLQRRSVIGELASRKRSLPFARLFRPGGFAECQYHLDAADRPRVCGRRKFLAHRRNCGHSGDYRGGRHAGLGSAFRSPRRKAVASRSSLAAGRSGMA
ncbi:MAG TPA: MFS transporter, partial [Micropepsaceae bacterium]|nr:MFS transporter [Micropepsaceae bacterium]